MEAVEHRAERLQRDYLPSICKPVARGRVGRAADWQNPPGSRQARRSFALL